jgi:orotidine-5'-phosphate decarboxylase
LKKDRHSKSSFREAIQEASKNNFSKIILALDLNGSASGQMLRTSRNLLEKTAPYICAVKFGRQTVLNLGTERTRTLIKHAHANDLPCIIDDKLNDIDETNKAIAEAYFGLGFDGIIVNPFVGWKGGLQPVFKLARDNGKGVIVLVYMSHPGAAESYGQLVFNGHNKRPRPQFEIFAEKAGLWKADGAVVGATRPDIVRKVKAKLRDGVRIYSPGIGAQGGEILSTSRAGTDFFIIGRSITTASDPEKIVHNYARQSMNGTH